MYEAIHIHGTSPFDLAVIDKLHFIAAHIGTYLNDMITKKDYVLNRLEKVMQVPLVYIRIYDGINVSAQVQDMPAADGGGYLISISPNLISTGEVDDVVFVNIMHEVVHIMQRELGVNPSQSSIGSTGNTLTNIHFNDPTEVNAYLLSVVGLITYSKKSIEKYKNMSFDVFYKSILKAIGYSAEELFDKHMTSGDPHNSTKDQLVTTLKLIHKRLQSGYFSHLAKI